MTQKGNKTNVVFGSGSFILRRPDSSANCVIALHCDLVGLEESFVCGQQTQPGSLADISAQIPIFDWSNSGTFIETLYNPSFSVGHDLRAAYPPAVVCLIELFAEMTQIFLICVQFCSLVCTMFFQATTQDAQTSP